MSFFGEFKKFAMRGNVVDLAVGVVIGAAFGKIVTALVDDLIMPPIGFLVGGINFGDLVLTLGSPVTDAKGKVISGGAILRYGDFVNTVIQFAIIALAVFLLVKLMNRLIRREEAAPPAPPPPDVVLLTEIRDILKAK